MRIFYRWHIRTVPWAMVCSTVVAVGSSRSLAGQWPGEISGYVTDATSGRPLASVRVLLRPGGVVVHTGGAGRFHARGLEPGSYTLTAESLGYGVLERSVSVENGRVVHLSLTLMPEAVGLDDIVVPINAADAPGSTLVGRAAIEASGALTAGDVLARLPGLVVEERTRGGAQTLSIRGSGADAVLVLLDGAPMNDPISGEADLSTLPVAAIEQVVVLKGARSARYGPRAEAGVVLITSRAAEQPLRVSSTLGSLGQAVGRAGGGITVGRTVLGASGEVRAVGGSFDFELPEELGGGAGRRRNSDVDQLSAQLTLEHDLGAGDLRATVGGETLERGLPGKSFGPADSARQDLDRLRGSAAWRVTTRRTTAAAVAYGTWQSVRYHDSAPPFGVPFDDRTDLFSGGIRLNVSRSLSGARPEVLGGGFDLQRQTIDASELSDGAPGARTDLGIFLMSAADLWEAGRLSVTGRMHRDGLRDEWRGTHEVSASLPVGVLEVSLTHRSAYSPPTLGDQFFREGVAVQANPALAPERIPSEVEVTASVRRDAFGGVLDLAASAFDGDVKGMIVWLPDFRFVWSPRNVDVKRSGVETSASIDLPGPGVRLSASYTLSRVTYDRPDSDTVQVAYRPRHTATVGVDLRRGLWSLGLFTRYLGARFPVPNPINELPGFWTSDVSASREVRLGDLIADLSLRVDRIFNQKSTLVFAFPDPGRTLRLEVVLRR